MSLSIAEFEDLCRREKDAEQRDRLRAILMGLQGFTSDETAARIGRSQRFVQKWAAIYQAGGIEVVQQRKAPGAKSKLSQEEEAQFSGEIMALLRAEGRVKGKAVVELLRRNFSQEYSLQGAYELMHRLGLPIRHPRLERERVRVPAPSRAPAAASRGGREGMDDAVAPHLLAAVLEGVGDGVLVVDPAGRVLLWNAKFLELWGIPAESAAVRDDAALLAGMLGKVRDPSAFLARVQALYAAPMQASSDELALCDGRFFVRHARPYLVDGRVVGRVWVFRDMTAQVKAELALRAHEARHSHVSAALAGLMEQVELQGHDDALAVPRLASECLARTLGVSRAGVWFLADEDTQLRCDCPYDAGLGVHGAPVVWLASQCPHYFAATARKRELLAHDACVHPATLEMAADYLAPLGVVSLLDAPICREGRVVGVVRLEQTGAACRRFASEDSLMAGMVAGLVARHLGEVALRQAEGAQASVRMRAGRKSVQAPGVVPSKP